MIPFYNKHNQIYPILWEGRRAVEQCFRCPEDWEVVQKAYSALADVLLCPEVLYSAPGILVTAYYPYPTLLEELERQEREGFAAAPWKTLAAWLKLCGNRIGFLPAEGSLRNFLWNAETGQVLGVHFENLHAVPLEQYAAALTASLLEYHPADTVIKKQAAALLIERLSMSEDEVRKARAVLQTAGEHHMLRDFSGIILAGGKSSRMGCNKAGLPLAGKTLLEHQIEKLQQLGIRDIILSGANCPQVLGTRVIPDIYPQRGPLGGLHACLQAAKQPQALVLSVDVPLVPVAALDHLCRAHTGGVTVLRHGGMQEPLIGVYDSGLAKTVSTLIQKGSAAVRALETVTAWKCWDYPGPEELLHNCNTPEDLQTAEELFLRQIF